MAIVVLLIFVHSIVKAEYSSILDERREELQEELDIASQEMEQIEINLTKTLEELNILKDRIENYISEINTLDIDLLLIYNNILDIEKRLEHVEQDYELQKGVFEKRVVAMYELGEIQYLDVLLSSRSLSEFVSNYFLISEIAAFDIELLDTIEREKILIDTIKEILEEKRLELKVVKDGRERTVVALENSQIIQDE
jgi:peptidoglycan hydrolase CwlO-like protein